MLLKGIQLTIEVDSFPFWMCVFRLSNDFGILKKKVTAAPEVQFLNLFQSLMHYFFFSLILSLITPID